MEALVGIPIKLSFVWVDVITRGIFPSFPGVSHPLQNVTLGLATLNTTTERTDNGSKAARAMG